MFADGGRRRRRIQYAVLAAGMLFGVAAAGLNPGWIDSARALFDNSPVTTTVHVPLTLPAPQSTHAGASSPATGPGDPSHSLQAASVLPATASMSEQTAVASVEAAPVLIKSTPEPIPSPPMSLSLRETQVKKGDSLSRIFTRIGLTQKALMEMLAGLPHKKSLRSLRPGDRIEFWLDGDDTLQRLAWHKDIENALVISRKSAGFDSVWQHLALDRQATSTSAVIDSSLFVAGKKAGLSDRLIMQLIAVFGWDVDFALDVRKGDRFTVIYEDLYKGDQQVREGNIIAAEFVNRGRSVRALRFENEEGGSGYYTPEGRSMRKAFLRTPVKFSRISSRFSSKRRHPVLSKMRAHKGVDYAAPRGTPVRASGDGKVISAGRKGGYGKAIVLRHGGRYTTLYAHLSRIARGIKRGKKIRQGQLIGYVGSTGLATGPHLHYEFRINGVHRNPLTVALPRAAPLAAPVRAEFLTRTRELVAQLDQLSDKTFALNAQ